MSTLGVLSTVFTCIGGMDGLSFSTLIIMFTAVDKMVFAPLGITGVVITSSISASGTLVTNAEMAEVGSSAVF
jgi:hypothetical protein